MSTSARVAAPSPRMRQPYSPRHPSPLGFHPTGFPPLAPHMAFTTAAPYPVTPSRPVQPKGPSESRVAFPPDARRPLAGAQRPRSQPTRADPPPALVLTGPYHPPTQLTYPSGPNQGQGQYQMYGQTQPSARRDMASSGIMHSSPPSPTNSSTSSLSLYSADSATKNFPVEVVDNQRRQQQEQEEEEERRKAGGIFCGCISFKALFGYKSSKNSKILGPPAAATPPAPEPQMTQVPRRRPTPLNLESHPYRF